jgi:hypothetical protein
MRFFPVQPRLKSTLLFETNYNDDHIDKGGTAKYIFQILIPSIVVRPRIPLAIPLLNVVRPWPYWPYWWRAQRPNHSATTPRHKVTSC